MKILVLLFFVGALAEAGNYIFRYLFSNNLWIINVFSLFEAIVLFYILREWQYKKWVKNVSIVLFVIYLLFWIYSTCISGSFFEFNDMEKTIKAIFLIFLSIYPMIGFSLDDKLPVYQNYKFWICSALLLYFSVSVVLFSTASLAIDNTKANEYTWKIHSYINIFSNFIFAYGFLWYSRKMT